MPYLSRVVDAELAERLAATGAVVVEGPKACGKTATARRLAASEVLFDIDANARQAVSVDPGLVLEGPTPRLLDEWQLVPELWNHVRRTIDDRRATGQFILTGSSVPSDDITRHTGAGRLTRLRMRPMSLHEAGDSIAAVSLGSVMDGRAVRSPDPGLTARDLARFVARGGWPAHRDLSDAAALRAVRDYLEEIRRVDVSRVDDVRRDPDRVGRMLRSLARHVATYASATTIARDAGGADGALKDDTVRDYLSVLGRLMIVEDQPSWAPHLRSRYLVRSARKRHFVDPSLAVAAVGASPQALLRDLNYLGFLFESLVVRDLRIYAQAMGATVSQYRDQRGLEVDAVVQGADGRWAAFEAKLGGGMADEAATNLMRFADDIDTARSGAPVALGVIVGSGYGYMRDDGIAVIPIGALGP